MAAVESSGADPYANPAKVPARVEIKNRPMRDKTALIIFVIALIANLALGIMIITSVQGPAALMETFNTCVTDNNAYQTPFTQEQIDLVKSNVKEAENEAAAFSASAAGSISLDGITKNPGVLIGLGFAVLAVAGLWVFLLYKFTKTMVWGTLYFQVAVIAVVGAILLTSVEGATSAGAVYLALAVLDLLILLYLRNNVNMAAGLINLAMQALRDFPSLIIAAILINFSVLIVYAIQLVFIIFAMTNLTFGPKSGSDILGPQSSSSTPDDDTSGTSSRMLQSSSSVLNGKSIGIDPNQMYCVLGQSGTGLVGQYVFAVLLLWITATFEAIRMAIASTVFGVFYYFDADDPEKPKSAVCSATWWALTVQLGTHAISGMVLAIIDQLKRMAKRNGGGIAGLIIRLIILCILSLIEQLSKFVVVMTGLTGLSFWDSAKRTMTVMKEAFVDGYISSRITIRVLRLSGYVFALVFGIIAWALVDANSFSSIWWFVFIIMIGIISPIFGIVIALVVSSFSAMFASIAASSGSSDTNIMSGPLAGLFFGSIAHAVLLFMEQVILDLVDAAFMCFALDTHNSIISPRGETVHRFMGANFGDQLSDAGKASAGKAGPDGIPVATPVGATPVQLFYAGF